MRLCDRGARSCPHLRSREPALPRRSPCRSVDGTLPPDNRDTTRRCSRLARVSLVVAVACSTLASAEASVACDLATWSVEQREVEPRQHLPLLDAVVFVHQDHVDQPRSSLPTSTLIGGLQGAGGRDT